MIPKYIRGFRDILVLLETIYWARKSRIVTVEAWHGELGYELLYWIPFLKFLLSFGDFELVKINSRFGMEKLYRQELRNRCAVVDFSSNYEFLGTHKQIMYARQPRQKDGELFVNAAAIYTIVRLVRSGYLPLWLSAKFFRFPNGVSKQNQSPNQPSSALLWIYSNDYLDFDDDAIEIAVTKLLLEKKSLQKVFIACGDETDRAHPDYSFHELNKKLPKVKFEFVKYSKQFHSSSFASLIETATSVDLLVCTAGGGSYLAYYGSASLVTIANKRQALFKNHRYYEKLMENSTLTQRETIELKRP